MRSRLAAALLLAAAAALFVLAFSRLPIQNGGLAIDWKQIWAGTHGLVAHYGATELRTPPWALPAVWPLTLLPLAPSWALAACATLAVLALAVPPGRKWLLGVLALATSYPALRQLVDGNLEALVIAGVLLLLPQAAATADRRRPWLLAAGLLLATAKIQETWLLLALLGLLVWRSWPRPQLARAAGLTLLCAAPLLAWKGGEWWQAMVTFPWPGTAIDSSLGAFAARTAPWLLWVLWPLVLLVTLATLRARPQLDRLSTGALLAAGLLLAPYAASNSVLTPLALAGPALLQRRAWLGAAAFALADLPYLFLGNLAWRTNFESNYWTVFLLLLWAISLWELHSVGQERSQNSG